MNKNKYSKKFFIVFIAITIIIIGSIIGYFYFADVQIKSSIAQLCNEDTENIKLESFEEVYSKSEFSCLDFGYMISNKNKTSTLLTQNSDYLKNIILFIFDNESEYTNSFIEEFNIDLKSVIQNNNSIKYEIMNTLLVKLLNSLFIDENVFSTTIDLYTSLFNKEDISALLDYNAAYYGNYKEIAHKFDVLDLSNITIETKNESSDYFVYFVEFNKINNSHTNYFDFRYELLDYAIDRKLDPYSISSWNEDLFAYYAMEGGVGFWDENDFPFINVSLAKDIFSNLGSKKESIIYQVLMNNVNPKAFSGSHLVDLETLKFTKNVVGDLHPYINLHYMEKFGDLFYNGQYRELYKDYTPLDQFLSEFGIYPDKGTDSDYRDMYRFLKSNGALCSSECMYEKYIK